MKEDIVARSSTCSKRARNARSTNATNYVYKPRNKNIVTQCGMQFRRLNMNPRIDNTENKKPLKKAKTESASNSRVKKVKRC